MKLSHVDDSGKASMVDVSDKVVTARIAKAYGKIFMSEKCFTAVKQNLIKKGDVLGVAKIAGIQAAKKTSDLIPLCHPLMLTQIECDFELDEQFYCIHIYSSCKLSGKTGVEMEALTVVSVAALTIFDMCKALDPAMIIDEIKVIEKKGGKSGSWHRLEENS